MFFYAAKLTGILTFPSNFLSLAALLGIILMLTRFTRAGRALVTFSVVLLAVFGLTPIGNALIIPLENRFPPWNAARGEPDGIIILGGSFDTIVALARGEVTLNEAAERIFVVPELARRFANARIVFTGGTSSVFHKEATEAEMARLIFEQLGVKLDRVTFEDQSRNTAENAAFTAAMLKPKPGERWLLVTSAYHMPRAMGAFRAAGFTVEAYPVDWRTRGLDDLTRPLATAADGLHRVDTAVKEWLGLLSYWATSRTAEFFPGP